MTNKEIDAVIPTISERPQVWYDKINELIEAGFKAKHETAEWVNPVTQERGRICWTPTKAWLRHPHPDFAGDFAKALTKAGMIGYDK